MGRRPSRRLALRDAATLAVAALVAATLTIPGHGAPEPTVRTGDPAAPDPLLAALHFGRDPGAVCQPDAESLPQASQPTLAETLSVGARPGPATIAPPARSPLAAAVESERSDHVFQTDRFGRYSVRVTSAQGAALQLVDRMAGPGPVSGAPGQENGRLDVFLGPGDHKAILRSVKGARLPAELSVKPFEELNGATLPRLVELAEIDAPLADFQQRSYWLELDTPRTIFIEAAGRHLEDLRLWREGTWLVDLVPETAVSEPLPGKPLGIRRLVARLEPGLYQLVAYGGVGQSWTQPGDERPFHLRWGIPRLPETGRTPFVTGPMGYDRWLLPKTANTFRIDLAQPGAASLEVAPFNDGHFTSGKLATIDKKSRDRSAQLHVSANGDQVVTVSRQAGLPYVLQSYAANALYSFQGSGQYLISTLRPGHDVDGPDDTPVLTRDDGKRDQVIAARVVELGRTTSWHRRFNLLDPVTLFVAATEPGRYSLAGAGADADYSLAPLGAPDAVQRPGARAGTADWDLDAGLYGLTITPRPEGRGALDLTLRGDGAAGATEEAAAGRGATFVGVPLDARATYHLRSNRTPGGPLGVVVRKLPVDPSEAVPLVIEPCSTMTVPVTIPAAGTLQALTDEGLALKLTLGPGEPMDKVTLAGPRMAEVKILNPAAGAREVLLGFVPAAARPLPPLPPITAASLARLPDFPKLQPGTPRHLDLERQSSATFLVSVDRPALYRIESTGLLQTTGQIRTRVEPSLDSAAANGTGRNFLLQQYLREGVYQLTAGTQGETQGHLGLTIAATPVQDGGNLGLETPSHALLAAGEGLVYGLDLVRPGSYRIHALTLAGPTGIRLEDADGWPLTNPRQKGDLDTELAPGHYRLVVLPPSLAARVTTLIEEVRDPVRRAGHGPFELPLDTTVSHRWDEPQAGERRVPDAWRFTLPAAADVTVTLSERMRADLKRVGDDAPIAGLNDRTPWTGRLAQGSYELDASTERPDNRFEYSLTTSLRQLVSGQERSVTPPAVVPVSIAAGRLLEIASSGGVEVRGALLDAADKVVARAADRPDDWNFVIAADPPTGEYRLKIDAVGETAGPVTVRMRQFDEVAEPALAPGGTVVVADGKLHLFPIVPAATDGTLLVAAARSRDAVGLSIELQSADGGWTPVGNAASRTPHLALVSGGAAPSRYRLNLWSLDHTPAPITLRLQALVPPEASERALANGLALKEIAGFDPPLGIAAVRLDKPGLFRLGRSPAGLAWATSADGRALRHGPDTIVAGGTRLWFIDDLAGGPIAASRVVPDAAQAFALSLQAGQRAALPFAVPASGAVVFLAESRVGQPAIALAPLDRPVDGRIPASGVDTAAAILPETRGTSEATVQLWRADQPSEDFTLSLRQIDFPKPQPAVPLPFGVTDRALGAGQAVPLTLPAGPKHVRLVLPPRVVAAFLKDNAVQRTIWSGTQPTDQVAESEADTVLLADVSGLGGAYSVDLAPAAAGGTRLVRGGIIREWLPDRGSQRLEVAVAPADRARGLLLRLAGAVESARLIQRDGTLLQGSSLTVTDDAVLVMSHRQGLVAAWLDAGDEASWPAAGAGPAARAETVPETVTLSGSEVQWRFETVSPTLLHVATETPVLIGFRRPSGLPELTVSGQGADFQGFLPAGTSLVGVKPLDEGGLNGPARIALSPPVQIGEGLGPKVRLAPGDARLFDFDLAQAGAVGVGVRGNADTARVRLLGDTGETLAEGAVAMISLAAGRYYLLVENRADGVASEVQPALVGATRPDTGPPEAVKRQFWELVAASGGN